MAEFLAKRGIWIGLGLLILVLAGAALAAVLAGNRISDAAIARELSDITGQRVVFASEPVISVFPALHVELKDVALHDWANASDEFPVLTVPRMRVSLSIWGALQGHVRVTGAVLDQPKFQAKAQNGNWQLPYSGQSRLAELIAILDLSQPQDQYEDALREIADNAFGDIQVINGSINLSNHAQDMINGVNADLRWQAGTKSGRLSGDGVWRNEAVTLTLQTDNVAMLMAGADTGVSAAFESAPLKTRFTGTARLQPAPFVEGAFFGEAKSVAAAAEWLGLQTQYQVSNLGLTLSAALKAEADKWQLEGTGGLIFQPNMSPPMVSGTLDFNVLDLAMLRQFFSHSQTTAESAPAIPALNSDLRISAKAASFGALALNTVAASLQISNQANTLDILNAAAFGGTLQMAIKSQTEPETGTELRILGADIETKAMASLGGPFTDLPQARGSISAILKGKDLGKPDFFETAEGTVKMRLGPGTIPGLNANQLVRALRKGGFFQLKTEAPSVLSFTEINADATLAQGSLQFDPLKIGLDKAAMTLTGAFAVKDQSIALSGAVDLEAGHPEAPNGAENLKVFFGGNWQTPLMSGLKGTP
jgi:AsmA protein